MGCSPAFPWVLGVLSLEGIDLVPEIDFRDSDVFTIENMNWKRRVSLVKSFGPFSLMVTHTMRR